MLAMPLSKLPSYFKRVTAPSLKDPEHMKMPLKVISEVTQQVRQ